MNYDFDKAIDRRGTGSVKWDHVDALFRGDGLLPLWVADMDFESPPEVITALAERARHGVFGYTMAGPEYRDALVAWFRDRHGWSIDPSRLLHAPGVVPALNILIQTLTDPGDRVIIQKPVYHPFMTSIEKNGREILNNPLVLRDGAYRMDFDDLARKAANPRARLMILCNPHNPVGRAWSREELRRLGGICAARGITVISDEIHCDLVHSGHRHVPFASTGEECLMSSITCLSPGKTFNLAGLGASAIIVPDKKLRDDFNQAKAGMVPGLNIFSLAAMEAAFKYGDEWLEQLLAYLQKNLDFTLDFFRQRIPRIAAIKPEGTYLLWLDCRALGLDDSALRTFMREQARLGLDDGFLFGHGGSGFQRMNIACPRSLLEEALQRLEKAVNNLP